MLTSESHDVAVIQIGFQLEQRDSAAVAGDISLGVMCTTSDTRIDSLAELSKLLPSAEPPPPKHLRDKLVNAFAKYADNLKRDGEKVIVGRSVVRITYDRALVQTREAVDTVFPKFLVAQTGVQDRRNDLWFPGVNARKVFLFHGKIHPEVAGLVDNEVVSQGLHRATKLEKKSVKSQSATRRKG